MTSNRTTFLESDPVNFFSRKLEGYGEQAKAKEFYERSQRRAFNVPAAYVGLILPWIVFCVIYCLMSFHGYYARPDICVCIVALVGIGILFFGIYVTMQRIRKVIGSEDGEPNWYIFLFLTSVVAWGCGLAFGKLNFETNMQPYYSYVDLETYTDVSPSTMIGPQFMDAASLAFSNDTKLDLTKSMGFRNVDTYCVAPITAEGQQLTSYDFWAVGLDCCTSNSNDFQCGNSYRKQGMHGLRLLEDSQRPFFRLAIQQASAAHQIKATHPLMFYWVQDANAEVHHFRDMGYRYCMIGIVVHFVWQTLSVVLAAAAFRRSKGVPL